MKIKGSFLVQGAPLLALVFALYSCAAREDKGATAGKPAPAAEAKAPPAVEPKAPAPGAAEKAPEAKAKPIKAKGDVGLLDLEKNYLIVVTKEGKLITLDFTEKTKVTQITPTESKMADIGLGSSATVEFQTVGEKKTITKIEYRAVKGGE